MSDKRGSIFSPQVKRQSIFGSPNTVNSPNVGHASNFQKGKDGIQEEEAKHEDPNSKSNF